MKRPRIGRSNKRASYRDQLLKSMGRHLPHQGLPLRSEDQRVRWTDRLVVVTAVLMAWCATEHQQDAFEEARETTVKLYPSRRRPGKTLGGFLAALVKLNVGLLAVVVAALRRASERAAGAHWRVGLWVVMSVDGTRVECPRTPANEEAFGYAGKKKSVPQQCLTTVFHVLSGLIWDWRRGPGDQAERTQLREMLVGLPDSTLLLADAGFTGYDLLKAVLALGHQFIMRVGKNVRLLTELGYAVKENKGTAYLWPADHQEQAPLTLRLVRVKDRDRKVYLLTSVLDREQLSNRQIGALYRLRWGIEVLYRSLKQTMGKSKLRSDSPEAARAELDWAMVGLWLLGLMAIEQIVKSGRRPGCWSVAESQRAVRRAMRQGDAPIRQGGLFGQLRRAVKDSYRRTGPKATRPWPRKKREHPPGAPKIRMAKPQEIRKAQAFKAAAAAG